MTEVPIEDLDETEREAINAMAANQDGEHHSEMSADDAYALGYRRGLRSGALGMMRFAFRSLRLLVQYRGNRELALDCFAFAFGQGEMIGAKDYVDIAVKHFSTKARKWTAGKIIKHFQESLGIPPMPGQRSVEGRNQMRLAREKQLK